jgi:hypothetical protein
MLGVVLLTSAKPEEIGDWQAVRAFSFCQSDSEKKGIIMKKIVVATQDAAEIFAELPCFAHVIGIPEQ